MSLTDEQYEALAAKYLKALARRDMAAWRQRVRGMIACDNEDDNPSSEMAKQIGRLKRVHHQRRDDD